MQGLGESGSYDHITELKQTKWREMLLQQSMEPFQSEPELVWFSTYAGSCLDTKLKAGNAKWFSKLLKILMGELWMCFFF